MRIVQMFYMRNTPGEHLKIEKITLSDVLEAPGILLCTFSFEDIHLLCSNPVCSILSLMLTKFEQQKIELYTACFHEGYLGLSDQTGIAFSLTQRPPFQIPSM